MLDTQKSLSLRSSLESEEIIFANLQPLDRFLIALKAPETKRHYPRMLKVFFDCCLNNSKDLNYQAIQFVKNGKDNSWMYSKIINFILYQKERMNKGEIAAGTVRNYIKAIKLFCEMNDVLLN